jgi:iron-sulfur cluster repair protein YtfE (RIC family)
VSANADTQRFETITTYLSWDHDRLDTQLEQAARDARAGRFEEARAAHRRFRTGLERHMRIEEDLLFPLFEARSGISGGPTTVMRDEHRQIRRAVEAMAEGLEAGDVRRFGEGLSFLNSVLPEHNAKEQHVLYPTTDRLLSAAERETFTARILRE